MFLAIFSSKKNSHNKVIPCLRFIIVILLARDIMLFHVQNWELFTPLWYALDKPARLTANGCQNS